MGRKKNNQFKLSPQWLLKRPLDFEYNKYTLLDYLQKCENVFNNLELYPDFIELSLHLANVQSIYKQKKFLTTNKKFDSCDDEILIRDLVETSYPDLSEDEQIELEKTLTYSGIKLFDTFNMAKSIWNLVFDNIDILVRKNRNGIIHNKGFVFHVRKDTSTIILWEYVMKKQKSKMDKLMFNQIYEGTISEKLISDAIYEHTTLQNHKELPIFEVYCSKYFPMEQTLIPMIKRKIQAYIVQTIGFQQMSNFDIRD
jgi:hypothetical protein